MTMGAVLKFGRAGLLVDFPTVAEYGATSVADMQNGGKRATIAYYPAHTIINWRTEQIGASNVLTLIVLREVESQLGEFGYDLDTIYRVLRFKDGVYTQEVWRRDEATTVNGESEYKLDTVTMPLDGNGQPWKEIPFQFVGALSNKPEMETYGGIETFFPNTMMSPLYDLAVLNIAHYRNSADYEASSFICGQPQPWMSGLDVEWRDSLLKNGISIGGGTVIPLPQGGTFGIAQASPNPLVRQAMLDKQDQMHQLGAKLIEMQRSNKTATQSLHDMGNDNSVLALACDNVSNAYQQALNWAARFMGAEENAVFSIDTEFVTNSLDAVSIQAVVAAWQAKAIPDSDKNSAMRKLGVIDSQKSDDDIQAELDAQGPPLGMLGDTTQPPPTPPLGNAPGQFGANGNV
jgi:hypothetical protein